MRLFCVESDIKLYHSLVIRIVELVEFSVLRLCNICVYDVLRNELLLKVFQRMQFRFHKN